MSQPVPRIQTFRDPASSLWQSALHKAITRQAATAAAAAGVAPGEARPFALGLGASAADPHMLATVAAVTAHEKMLVVLLKEIQAQARGVEEVEESPDGAGGDHDVHFVVEAAQGHHVGVADVISAATSVGHTLAECARLYLKGAMAEFHRNKADLASFKNERKDSECDPLWSEAFFDYEKFRRLARRPIPYVPYPPGQLATFAVLDTLPNKRTVTVALVADWGTGMDDAQALLGQIKAKSPDVVIHLGDIYYAGTPDEVQSNFYGVYQQVFGANPPPLYTLSGNHDMYSGGVGYYGLLRQLNQWTSYFCLRNENWQFLAMDTGLNDSTVHLLPTMPDLTFLNLPEVAWQQDKIVNAGGRKTVLLSHHQLFSAFESVGKDAKGRSHACNPNLQEAFTANGQNLLEQVAWWFWGHEHNLEIYQPYVGLAHGCCIGAGAVPILDVEAPYTPATGLTLPLGEKQLPQLVAGTELGTNGTVYNHAYAIMTLACANATVTFYQVKMGVENGKLVYQESVVHTVE